MAVFTQSLKWLSSQGIDTLDYVSPSISHDRHTSRNIQTDWKIRLGDLHDDLTSSLKKKMQAWYHSLKNL